MRGAYSSLCEAGNSRAVVFQMGELLQAVLHQSLPGEDRLVGVGMKAAWTARQREKGDGVWQTVAVLWVGLIVQAESPEG